MTKYYDFNGFAFYMFFSLFSFDYIHLQINYMKCKAILWILSVRFGLTAQLDYLWWSNFGFFAPKGRHGEKSQIWRLMTIFTLY